MSAQDYDAAISFLSKDEPLAVKIHDELCENLSVFVYSKRQEELAGTDGLESLRQAFLSKCRLVVVLYRDGWGRTPWTAVEELAIKDRMFNGGWKSLLFVMLDEHSTPPGWLPETHIRLSYARYREALIGAIKMRAQEQGSELKIETAVEKAKRTQSLELARAERKELLISQGMMAAQKERDKLRHELDKKIVDIQSNLTTFKLERGADSHEYVIRTDRVSLNFYLYITSPVTQSRIIVQEFDGPLILPGQRSSRMFIPGEEPCSVSKVEFYFDYDAAYGWCWRQKHGGLLTTSDLSEHLVKRYSNFMNSSQAASEFANVRKRMVALLRSGHNRPLFVNRESRPRFSLFPDFVGGLNVARSFRLDAANHTLVRRENLPFLPQQNYRQAPLP